MKVYKAVSYTHLSAIEQEIANYEKQLRQSYATKSRLIDEIDTLDPDDKDVYKRQCQFRRSICSIG